MKTYKKYRRRTDKILEKAEVQKRERQKRRKRVTVISVLSAAAAFLLALNLTLFLPYTVGGYDISVYAGSEYYALMDEIANLTYSPPRQTNNFNQWCKGFSFFACSAAPDVDLDAPSDEGDPGATSGPPTYEEVTNNQVNGVIEGDLLKRSDRYFYYLGYKPEQYFPGGEVLKGEDGEPILDENGDKQLSSARIEPAKILLDIFSMDGEHISSYQIPSDGVFDFGKSYAERREMYLSKDCSKVTVLVPYFNAAVRGVCVMLVQIDVSDPTAPRETARCSVSGDYISSRLAGDVLLLVSNFRVVHDPDFSKPEQYLPAAGDETLPAENIEIPENPKSARFTVLTSFDADTLSVNDSVAYFDFSTEVYVSEQNLYTVRNFIGEYRYPAEFYPNGYVPYRQDSTEIACTGYDGDSLTRRGKMTVPGTINDQYSLDEYKGVLRVFTTSEITRSLQRGDLDPLNARYNCSECNLYCFDLATFERIACLENFAPKNESVRSVRFDKDVAYVCTSKTVSYANIDPVYEFDLSDYANITSKNTGTIPGYSLNLIKFFGGTLLGIGYDETMDVMKIEVYETVGNSVVSLDKFTREARFSSQFKAYFIDAENGLVGLYASMDGQNGYLLLRFDGYRLNQVAFLTEISGNGDEMRACLVDGTLYVFSRNDIASSLYMKKLSA